MLLVSAICSSQSIEAAGKSNIDEAQIAKLKQSILDYSIQINEQGYNPKIYRKRAIAYFVLKEFEKSISDLNMLIDQKAENLAELYYYRGFNKFIMNTNDECEDLYKSKAMDYNANWEMLLIKCQN